MTNQSSKAQAEDYFCDSPENIRELRPFYWVVLAMMAMLYIWSLSESPALRTLSRLMPFTGLMLIHASLHWISPYLTTRRRWLLPYLLVQGALAFAINLLVGRQGMVLGLYLALAGEAAGILENVRLSLIAVAGFLALAAINFGWQWGWTGLSWWLLTSVPMAFFVVVFVTLFNREARARTRAQTLLRELEAAHRQLAEYADQVETLTLATERQRMARELHDTLAQGLAGLILQLEAANSHLASGRPERAKEILVQAMTRARDTLADARCAIGDLRQGAAVPGDLSEAVRKEADHFAAATGIACTLDLDSLPPLPDAVREHALRVVSEGLTNVARHAQAGQVWIRLASDDDCFEVEVRDDGVGFDPATVESGHYGLLGMCERARLAGGTLDIVSAVGAGARLRLQLPLPE